MTTEHKRYAVGWYNLFENRLVIEIHVGSDWRTAAIQHTDVSSFFTLEPTPGMTLLPAELEAAKEEAFNMDGGLDVVEINEA